jgi:hypothetical protein
MEAHAMSLIRSRFAVSRCWGLLAVLFLAVFSLALSHPPVATAQEMKQIKLTEKHMQGFIAVSEDMAKLYEYCDLHRLNLVAYISDGRQILSSMRPLDSSIGDESVNPLFLK